MVNKVPNNPLDCEENVRASSVENNQQGTGLLLKIAYSIHLRLYLHVKTIPVETRWVHPEDHRFPFGVF